MLQDFKAILCRHMEVEDQQSSARPFDRGDCLCPIVNHIELVGISRSLECDLDEPSGGSIILSKDNPGTRRATGVFNHQGFSG